MHSFSPHLHSVPIERNAAEAEQGRQWVAYGDRAAQCTAYAQADSEGEAQGLMLLRPNRSIHVVSLLVIQYNTAHAHAQR